MANDAQETHSEKSNEERSQADGHETGPVRRLVRQFTQSTTIHNVHTKPIEAESVSAKSIGCGLAAGVIQAALFSPYDRALYLSMANQTPFLTMQNFHNPFVGLSQSIGGRALSGALFFPLEQFFFQRFNTSNSDARENSTLRCFASGTAAGAVNAMTLNPLSAIKYKTWSRLYNRGMLQEAFSMLRQGGRGVFYRGLTSTLMRDIAFGGCYTCIRLQLQWTWSLPHEHQWAANLFAASLATIVSGPFNLARNVQYATKSSQVAPTTFQVLKELAQETDAIDSLHQKSVYLQKRLRIGWGTARVATGMAFGHWVYDGLHALVHDHEESGLTRNGLVRHL
jgi:Mitochondrial carrier protein